MTSTATNRSVGQFRYRQTNETATFVTMQKSSDHAQAHWQVVERYGMIVALSLAGVSIHMQPEDALAIGRMLVEIAESAIQTRAECGTAVETKGAVA